MKIPLSLFRTVDALYLTDKSNIRYFSNFTGTLGYLFLTPKQKFLLTDFRYFLVAKSLLSPGYRIIDITNGFEHPWKKLLKKFRVTKIGIEEGDLNVHVWKKLKRLSRGVTFVDMGQRIRELRIEKSPEEIRKLKKAQEITDRVFSLLKKELRVGQTERDIAWHIEVLSRKCGAEDISFPPIIGINEHSASPHHQNTDRKLRRGDMILIDMGVIFDGYCSDMTRVLFTKSPIPEQKKIYEIVLSAQKRAIAGIKAGITGSKADFLARDFITKSGYGKFFGHSLGHGVGLDIHELPTLAQKYTGALPENTVVTVEPGIYLEGKFGIRIEDMVIVKKNGVELLTKSPKDMKEVIIDI